MVELPRRTGIGLRAVHTEAILRQRPAIPWLEVLVDNALGLPEDALRQLDRLRADYPMVFHGVGLNAGSEDPPDRNYLRQIAARAERLQPALYSEHLAWTGAGGRFHHDLLPLPLTEATLERFCSRAALAADLVGMPVAFENPAAYGRVRGSTITEPEFLNRLARSTGGGLLLDINNLWVSSWNLGFAAPSWLAALDTGQVRYLHLAGHQDHGTHLFDSHDGPAAAPVLDLLATFTGMAGPRPALLEWDTAIPDLDEVLAAAAQADRVLLAAPRMEEEAGRVP